jgi:hypothetical protein
MRASAVILCCLVVGQSDAFVFPSNAGHSGPNKAASVSQPAAASTELVAWHTVAARLEDIMWGESQNSAMLS